MNIMDLSEREILALQYSLLEELKQKPKETVVTATFNKEPTMSAEEYIKQRFKDKNGNEERDNHYLCRLSWFEMGCPKYNEFANKTNFTYSRLRKISSLYNWPEIRQNAVDRGYRPNNKQKFIDTSKKTVERDSKEYNRFRESVLKRDGVCQCCGSNEDLEVHHLFSFKKYNSLGADTKNGIVLCKECHTQYHSQYGTKKNNNPVTFSQFLRDYGMTPQTKLSDSFFDTHKGVVLEVIRRLQKEYGRGCPIKKLTPVLKGEWDLLEEDCDSFISSLIQKGLIYEPTIGYVKVVE